MPKKKRRSQSGKRKTNGEPERLRKGVRLRLAEELRQSAKKREKREPRGCSPKVKDSFGAGALKRRAAALVFSASNPFAARVSRYFHGSVGD